MFCALSVLEEKYIFKYKWVEMEDDACIIFQSQKNPNISIKSHNSREICLFILEKAQHTILHLYVPERCFLTRLK